MQNYKSELKHYMKLLELKIKIFSKRIKEKLMVINSFYFHSLEKR